MDKNNVSIFVGELNAAEMVRIIREKLAPFVNRTDIAILSDGVDEVSIPLSMIRAGFNQGFIVVELTVWSSIQGESVVVIPFRFSSALRSASLRVETEALPRGEHWLVQEWGDALREMVWNAIIAVAADFAEAANCEANLIGLYCDGQQFGYVLREVFETEPAMDYAETYVEDRVEESTLELLWQLAQSVEWKYKSQQLLNDSRVWVRTTLRNLHFWETRLVEYIKGNF